MVAKTETEIMREICDYLFMCGYFFWRNNNIPTAGRNFGSFRSLPKYTPRGLPDIFMIRNGIMIGIEVKRPASEEREANGRKVRAGHLKPDQAEFATKMVMNGGRFIIAHSVEEVRSELLVIV